MNKQIVWLDLETTGLDTQRCGIIELGAMIVNPSRDEWSEPEWRTFDSTMNPGAVDHSEQAFKVNGFHPDDLTGFEPIDSVMMRFDEQIDNGAVIAGWNVSGFDIPMLKTTYKRLGLDWRFDYHTIDVMCAAMWLQMIGALPRDLKISLQPVAEFFGIASTGAHRALVDISITVAVSDALNDYIPY